MMLLNTWLIATHQILIKQSIDNQKCWIPANLVSQNRPNWSRPLYQMAKWISPLYFKSRWVNHGLGKIPTRNRLGQFCQPKTKLQLYFPIDLIRILTSLWDKFTFTLSIPNLYLIIKRGNFFRSNHFFYLFASPSIVFFLSVCLSLDCVLYFATCERSQAWGREATPCSIVSDRD